MQACGTQSSLSGSTLLATLLKGSTGFTCGENVYCNVRVDLRLTLW